MVEKFPPSTMRKFILIAFLVMFIALCYAEKQERNAKTEVKETHEIKDIIQTVQKDELNEKNETDPTIQPIETVQPNKITPDNHRNDTQEDISKTIFDLKMKYKTLNKRVNHHDSLLETLRKAIESITQSFKNTVGTFIG